MAVRSTAQEAALGGPPRRVRSLQKEPRGREWARLLEHPATALGFLLWTSGRLEKAAPVLEEAMAAAHLASVGPPDPSPLATLAGVYMELEEFEKVVEKGLECGALLDAQDAEGPELYKGHMLAVRATQ